MDGRVLMVAGEASGDLHGAGVVHALKAGHPDLDIYGIGGDRMAEAGMEILVHISSLSFMGFVEVAKNLHVVRRVEKQMAEVLEQRRPGVVVLIDYPGFNLRFARKVAALGIPVLYYISPQVWAWHKSRVKKMRGIVKSMKVVFPFEVEIYRKEGIDVEFVGHPIVEKLGVTADRPEFFRRHGLDESKKLLALLPGSRVQEINHMLPVMLEAARKLCLDGRTQPVLGVAPNLGRDPMSRFFPICPGLQILEHSIYDLMAFADAAVVTSGTATLETGWFGTPMLVVYKTSPITFAIGRMLVDVPYIGLANIVAGKKTVPELIQRDFTVEGIVREVGPMLRDNAYNASLREGLAVIKGALGGPGASARVAQSILALLKAA